ncbi:MAG TPA: hypothetical protein VF479_04865 [Pseudolysinimonas sp.]
MPSFVRRFRLTAAGVVGAILVLVAVAVVVVAVAVPRQDAMGDAILVVGIVAVAAVLALAAITSFRRAHALRRVTAQHPDDLVFMARRQPAVVSDLSVYLGERGITADVADRWLVGLVDDRGVSAWSITRTPTELLLMPWSELGAIEVCDLESGGGGRGIAVDVRPFDTPLVVAIGYAAFGLTSALSREGVAEVCRLANGLRPS